MAQLSLLQLDLKDAIQCDPVPARVEDVFYYDTANTPPTTLDKHRRMAFPIGTSVANAEAIWEYTLPTPYTGTTGLTVVFNWYAELPIITGSVVWEFAVSTVTANTAGNVVNQDAWGTPTVATATACSATAGQFVSQTINVTTNHVGNQNPAVGSLMRFRLRRLNTTANPTDTLLCTAYIIGSPDLQGY